MSEHKFAHPEIVQQLKQRDFIRKHCPNSSGGFCVEDLDLVIRTFGIMFQTDRIGRIRLIELKHGQAMMWKSKENTFGLIDYALRKALPERYDGFYLVQTDSDDWENLAEFRVNYHFLTQSDFIGWLNFQLVIKPYSFIEAFINNP